MLKKKDLVVLRVRVSKDEQKEIQRAAEAESRSVSSWVRLVALERARVLPR